ncbi:MAG: hypothetical protein HamCj_07800 [Candidatus Hamiltonella defensa (Ceratovacuna japonica)]
MFSIQASIKNILLANDQTTTSDTKKNFSDVTNVSNKFEIKPVNDTDKHYIIQQQAPIIEVPKCEVRKLVKNFKLSIKPLVENSLEFGDFFAIRAHEALTHADRISDKIKSSTNKVFSYQLDNKSVGLISANIFPQVIIIERLVGHPGVQNAGYLLLSTF